MVSLPEPPVWEKASLRTRCPGRRLKAPLELGRGFLGAFLCLHAVGAVGVFAG